MRITNIDTLSAYLDRLITENIKLYFFNKDGEQEKVTHQKEVIQEIRNKVVELLTESLESGKYIYKAEHRTFDEHSIVEQLEELIYNDINIGEADRARLEETKKENPNLERMIVNEKRLRKANEGRAANKNNIDSTFKRIIENE